MDTPRVLITGTAEAEGVALLHALREAAFDCYAGDCEPYAAGLFDLPAERRVLLPPAYDERFVPHLLAKCDSLGISMIVPARSEEMLTLSRAQGAFEAQGVRILADRPEALETVLDHWKWLPVCGEVVPVPKSALLTSDFDPSAWSFPVLVKPRWQGLALRGTLVEQPADLFQFPWGDHLLVQEYLPGEEYVVEFLPAHEARPAAVIPTVRLRTQSGQTEAVRTLRDRELIDLAQAVSQQVGLRGPFSIRLRRDRGDRLALVDVHPGFSAHVLAGVSAGLNLPAWAVLEALGTTPTTSSTNVLADVALVPQRRFEAVPVGEIEALEDEFLRLAVAQGGQSS